MHLYVEDLGGSKLFPPISELVDGRADLAVGAMTINFAREAVIDFTKPFMNLGISILFKIPSGKPTRLFSFMNPLAVEIWYVTYESFLVQIHLLSKYAKYVYKYCISTNTNNTNDGRDDVDFIVDLGSASVCIAGN